MTELKEENNNTKTTPKNELEEIKKELKSKIVYDNQKKLEEIQQQKQENEKIISSYYYLYTSISGFNSINKNEEENYFKNSDKYHQNLYFTNNIDINEINKIPSFQKK